MSIHSFYFPGTICLLVQNSWHTPPHPLPSCVALTGLKNSRHRVIALLPSLHIWPRCVEPPSMVDRKAPVMNMCCHYPKLCLSINTQPLFHVVAPCKRELVFCVRVCMCLCSLARRTVHIFGPSLCEVSGCLKER